MKLIHVSETSFEHIEGSPINTVFYLFKQPNYAIKECTTKGDVICNNLSYGGTNFVILNARRPVGATIFVAREHKQETLCRSL